MNIFFAYIDDDDICLSLFMILCPVGLSCEAFDLTQAFKTLWISEHWLFYSR